MMDSKQLALIYLTEEANKMSSICTKNVHSLHKKKTNADLEEQVGKLFCALKEVAEELKLNEQQVEGHAFAEYERRLKER